MLVDWEPEEPALSFQPSLSSPLGYGEALGKSLPVSGPLFPHLGKRQEPRGSLQRLEHQYHRHGVAVTPHHHHHTGPLSTPWSCPQLAPPSLCPVRVSEWQGQVGRQKEGLV